MWEARVFLPAFKAFSLASHRDIIFPPAVLDQVDTAELLRPVVDHLLSSEVEERTDLYVVLPIELSQRVGLKLRNAKKKVEVKVADDLVRGDGTVVVAGKWSKYERKFDDGLGKPKKVVAFLEECVSPFVRSAAQHLKEARAAVKQQHPPVDTESHQSVVRKGTSNSNEYDHFTRFPKFPLPLVQVAKQRRQNTAVVRRSVQIAFEETDVVLVMPHAKVAMRSWAIESTDQSVIEEMGAYWAKWLRTMDGTFTEAAGAGGVLSYPEVVRQFFDHVATTAAAHDGAARNGPSNL